MTRVAKTGQPAAAWRFTVILSVLLALTVLGTASVMILWLDSVPIKPAFSAKAMEAAWKPGKPTEFHVRIRSFPRRALSPGLRSRSGSPTLVGVEAAGRPIPVQQIAAYVWAKPHRGDFTIEGRTPKRPPSPVTVRIEMVETHRLPWWKRLLPAKWAMETVEVRYPLSNQVILADAPSGKARDGP